MDRTGTGGVVGLLRMQAARHPDREAFVVMRVDGTTERTGYGAFADHVERRAIALRDAGVAPGDAVVLHVGTSLAFLSTWVACFRLGALAVPTNLASPAPELVHAIRRTGATHVVSEPQFDQVMDAVVAEVELDTQFVVRRGGARLPRGMLDLDDLADDVPEGAVLDLPVPGGLAPAEVLFTSGTTSRPKGALLTHSTLLRAGQRVALHYRLTCADRSMSVMPLFHTGGQCMGVLAALTVGATCVLTEAYSASRFLDQVRAERATFVMLVTTHVRTLLAQPPRDDDRDHALRHVGFGLRITEEERDRFESRFGMRLTYCYGQTEACLLIAVAPLDADRNWPALGLPAFDREVRVVDVEGREVLPGDVGEIVVRADPGRNVLLRYADDPEATAQTLRDGWLHTGDNGRFDADGHLHFVDRRKDMIKRAGENISALEVETVLTAHAAIAEAAVIGIPDEIREEAVMAFVVLEPGATIDVDRIRAHCLEHLAPFKVPTVIELRADLPRTSIGKIAKGELRTEIRE